MMAEVLILGGYGNFGKRIAAALVKEGINVIIAGRDYTKAERLAKELGKGARAVAFDVHQALAEQLELLKPKVVVHCCGPFQHADYAVAQCCIRHRLHYIDLSDARSFVNGITSLDETAKKAGVSVISGASSVPGLSSAVVEAYRGEFRQIDSLKYGISPGQKAERGLATTKAIMSYVGKPLAPFATRQRLAYGWQDLYRQTYPELGKRWMANCEIPDLDLLPKAYGIKHIQFSAGLEISILHLGVWALSLLVRWGIPLPLEKSAFLLLRASNLLNYFGSADGGMHVLMRGVGQDGKPHQRSWFIIAKSGHGPHIPTIPAIILAKKLMRGQEIPRGAMACVGIVSLHEYLAELQQYDVTLYEA